MRPLFLLLGYVAIVFFTGALIAPWLYELGQWSAQNIPSAQWLRDTSFHRVVNRAVLLCVLLFLWPLLRRLRMNSWRELGLKWGHDSLKNAAAGFLIGWGSLALVAVIALLAGARKVNPNLTSTEILRLCVGAAISAVVVSLLEESVFRGALFGMLRRSHTWPVALVASSALYALVHFFRRPENPAAVDAFSGFIVLAKMLRGFADWQTFVPAFLLLLLAGIILGIAYQRSNDLFCSIGLHAGWIFWLKSYYALTVYIPGSNPAFWGTDKLIDGWVAFPVMMLVLALFLRQPQQLKPGVARAC